MPPIPSLTGLRFVAAMCVVISHAMTKLWPVADQTAIWSILANLSAFGMTLFFVLSGFVIYYNYAETIRERFGLYNFFVARFARLYPLYILCLIVDLLPFRHSANLSAALPYLLTLTHAWFYLPFEKYTIIYAFGSITSVSWSISAEWFFYLAFPLVCLALTRLKSRTATIFGTIAFCVCSLAIMLALVSAKSHIFVYGLQTFGPIGADPQDSFYRWLTYMSPYTRGLEFILGCLCARVFLLLKPPSERENFIGVFAIGAALLGIAILQVGMFGIKPSGFLHEIFIGMHVNFGFAPFSAVLIFCCARYTNFIVKSLSIPKIVLCGEASYSLYLLHLIIISRFATDRYSTMLTISNFAVAIAATIGFAIVIWAIIEVPSRQFIRRSLTIHTPKERTEKSEPQVAAN